MNERIKQLLGQAYDEAVPETWTTLSSIQLGRIYDKFAELIVRECMNIAQEYDGAKLSGPGLIIAMRIEQHFGVEE
jgi:hypothetical protein